MNMEISKIIIFSFIMGGIFTFLGWVMKSQNAGDMINGFDERKYDKTKTSKILGKNFLIMGLIIIGLGFTCFIIPSTYYDFIGKIQFVIIIIGLIISFYKFNKYCKKET